MKQDLTSQIKAVYIETRHSTKSDKDYSVFVVEFKNGYKNESFLNNDQLFILGSFATNPGNH